VSGIYGVTPAHPVTIAAERLLLALLARLAIIIPA